MGDKIVDLRRESERRDRERRVSLVKSATSRVKEDVDKVKEDNTDKRERREEEKKEQAREGLFWEASEYEYREKQQGLWIRNTLIVAIPLAIIFILTKNVLGVFLVVLGAGAFLLSAFRKPNSVEYGIDKRGVIVGGSVTVYEKLESFWIFPKEQGNMLSLKRAGALSQHLRVPIGDTDRETVRDALISHIKEIEQNPSISDVWLRRIGY